MSLFENLESISINSDRVVRGEALVEVNAAMFCEELVAADWVRRLAAPKRMTLPEASDAVDVTHPPHSAVGMAIWKF
jgi:hypothetical protein